jgi:Na+/H+-dicarboxylate symporter
MVDSGIWRSLYFIPYVTIDFAKVNPIKFFQSDCARSIISFLDKFKCHCTVDDGVTENVGVDEEVSSFVLPLGATVNGWYKSISGSSSHFIAQAMLPNPLDLNTQLMIVVTATLASIGSAAVPLVW